MAMPHELSRWKRPTSNLAYKLRASVSHVWYLQNPGDISSRPAVEFIRLSGRHLIHHKIGSDVSDSFTSALFCPDFLFFVP
jgi:hypothetical protein